MNDTITMVITEFLTFKCTHFGIKQSYFLIIFDLKHHLEHQLKIAKTARYYSLGDIDKSNHLLIVLHGYGQLSEFFIRKFKSLPNDYYIVAPEGLHRYYINGNTGRVGASWMTKEAREDDINDNNLYLDNLIEAILATKSFNRITLLGFSQGGATAARWFYETHHSIDQLILWASVFPPDISLENINTTLNNQKDNYFVVGNNDEFYKGEKQEEIKVEYMKLNFNIITFAGKHDIDSETLHRLLR